jgi:hypothetical protein
MTHDTPTDRPDDALDPRVAASAREYHRPPATPREEMWAVIAAARARRRARPRVLPLRRWRLGVGIAAVLTLGVALGRWSATRRAAPVDSAPATATDVAYQVAAAEVFSRTEVLLTSFRARAAAPDAQFMAAARDLLALTRLMRDAPATAHDPTLRTLLEDLELVLAQIVQLDPAAPSPDAELITEGLEARGLLSRLRSAIPAGPAAGPAGVM